VTRLLGIDLGERRIGVALGTDDGAPARALATVRRGRSIEADAATLGALVDAHDIDELVVGLPLEASGATGPMAAAASDWAAQIGTRLGKPVTLRDERFTSHLAEARIGPMPRGRSGGPPTRSQRDSYRARVDREAAAIILQDELDTRAGARSSMRRPPDPQESHR
jgi:putative Holliday junction resolvase